MTNVSGPSTPVEPLKQSQDMLEVFQGRVTKGLQGNDNVLKALDPTVWIGIFSAVVEMIGGCKKRPAEQVQASIKNPNFVQKVGLRRELVKQLGRATIRKMEMPLMDAITKVANEASAAEVKAFHEQVLAK